MKNRLHPIAGVLGFVLITVFLLSTLYAQFFGSHDSIVAVKSMIFKGVFLLILASAGAGATGMGLLGKKPDSLALTKQKRGPIAFMTSVFVLLPSAYFLSSWSAAGSFGPLYFAVQTLEILGSLVVFTMIGLNIRDGLTLTGRIAGGKKGEAPTISARDGGPLVAKSVPVLKSADGTEYESKAVAALCRCGASKNKPYCDGSHSAIEFDSSKSEERSKDGTLTYEGKELTVHYNRLLCSHAAECGKRSKAAFDSSRKPWIIADNATASEIKEIVNACPSGALRYSLPDKEPKLSNSGDVGITIEKDGPYRVAGIPLEDAELATGADPDKYVLCRCGASKNKPYCDGSHIDIGWSDAGTE